MGSEWPLVSLAEISERIGDGLHGTPEYSEYGEYYFINGNNLENGEITIKESTKKVDSTEYLRHKKELNSNAVLVSINGTIGNVALFNGEEVVLGKSACYINLKQDIHRDFVAYSLSSHQFQEYIERCATGSTIKNVSLKMMREFKFRMPVEETEQIKAVSSIRNIDNKIQLNRQTNQTLEGMAQALFKSWFVDFDPVFDNIIAHNLAHNNAPLHNIPEPLLPHAQRRLKAHNVGRGSARQTAAHAFHHLFPQVFEQSDEPSVGIQGWVPKGWGVSNVGNVSKCFDKKRIPLSKKQREEKKPGNIPYHGATSVMDHINEWIFDDVYLLIGEDGSVVKEDGSPFVQYIWGKSWVNNHAHVLQGDSGISTEHLMLFMQAQNIKAYITGAVQLKINQGNMNSIPFLKASGGVNATFSERIEIIYQKLRLLNDSNKSLIKLRDTLLPKLISGELRIPDAEQATEAFAK